MTTFAPPTQTFVSSLDVTFSDDEDAPGPIHASTSTAAGLGAAGAAAGGPGPASVKERHSATTFARPGARASKTNALAALNASRNAMSKEGASGASFEEPAAAASVASPPASRATTPSTAQESEAGPSAKHNPARRALKEPRAPPLDFSTLRTQAPRFPNPPPRPPGKERMFGLEHAPVYHPSIEEFAKPMEYIEMIAMEAKEYGICKIVPPEGWRPPFALDTETFRFKTRLQQLNSMEASARASLNFLEQLYLFHRQQGNVGITLPTIGDKPLDMWKLKREVTTLGGYAFVTNNRKWTAVGKAMGFPVHLNTMICSQLKTSYLKIIVPFEDYVKRVKLAGGTPPPDPAILNNDIPLLKEHPTAPLPSNNGADSLATPGSEADGPSARSEHLTTTSEKVRTASNKLNDALATNGIASVAIPKTASLLPPNVSKKASHEAKPGEVCEICTRDHDPDRIVLCDGCDRGYHLNCLSPPLHEVPTSQFFCETCLLLNGSDYGFEEGEDHSLHSFRRRADAFKKKWLLDHPLPVDKGKGRAVDGMDVDKNIFAEQIEIEDHFEREFWRLVESQTETVEIEYGADVNSTPDGGGLPNLEVHPADPYSRDGWNLNNLPILAGSLLRYIKSDISGMTIPWIYVGMVFSTFAWHKEDHYTYSINYHHWGDTKTWYGIPGSDDEKLEAAMKLAAPELFDQQPDLMFQLVTLMSPGRLKQHDVRVSVVDQRPNEFIITFPRAYHSGFNHGFNFNEAVNFALPDWLPTGLSCVNRYRDIKKNPVFSHDELLVTIFQHEKNPRNSRWLLPNWQEMVQREIDGRNALRAEHAALANLAEEVDPTDIDEEEYQCTHCKVLCFLSQIRSKKTNDIACLDHGSTLPNGPKRLHMRYSDDELTSMLAKVKSRSDKAGRIPEGTYIGTGFPIDRDQRTTGRKRKPSAIALEAALNNAVEEDDYSLEPAAQRQRMEDLDSSVGGELSDVHAPEDDTPAPSPPPFVNADIKVEPFGEAEELEVFEDGEDYEEYEVDSDGESLIIERITSTGAATPLANGPSSDVRMSEEA